MFVNVLNVYPGFIDNPLSTALRCHSGKTSAAVNNRSLDFVHPRAWIPLVNVNHVDSYLKEILAFVYYASIVNNRSKNNAKQPKRYRADEKLSETERQVSL